MRLCRVDQLPNEQVLAQFRHPPWTFLPIWLLFGGGAAGLIYASSRGLGWIGYAAGGLLALMWWIVTPQFLAAFRSGNWVMRITHRRVLLNIRSFRNPHFPQDVPTIAVIDRTEIASAFESTEIRRGVSSDNNTTHEKLRYLDIRLRHDQTEELDRAIREESGRRGPLRLGISSGRSSHVPVRVLEPGLVRITFCSRFDAVYPSIARALELLGMDSAPSAVTVRDWTVATGAELRACLDALCDSGDTMEAMDLLRRRYGYTSTQANEYLNRRQRMKAGVCIQCGYDLRATPLRCPECGREVTPLHPGDPMDGSTPMIV